MTVFPSHGGKFAFPELKALIGPINESDLAISLLVKSDLNHVSIGDPVASQRFPDLGCGAGGQWIAESDVSTGGKEKKADDGEEPEQCVHEESLTRE